MTDSTENRRMVHAELERDTIDPMTLPELHLADWRPTKDTLHLYCQIVVPAQRNSRRYPDV